MENNVTQTQQNQSTVKKKKTQDSIIYTGNVTVL